MNLRMYDEAFLKKLKTVFVNTIMCNTEKAISESRNSSNEIYLPLLSFWRISNNYDPSSPYQVDGFNKRGFTSRIDKAMFEAVKAKSYVLDIYYQVDIWSDKREEIDMIYRELIMFFLQDPDIEVSIAGQTEVFSVLISETDTTPDMSDFTDRGKLYRNSITVHIPYARMVFEDVSPLIREVEVRVYNMGENEELEEV